jgi:hypothetical protein
MEASAGAITDSRDLPIHPTRRENMEVTQEPEATGDDTKDVAQGTSEGHRVENGATNIDPSDSKKRKRNRKPKSKRGAVWILLQTLGCQDNLPLDRTSPLDLRNTTSTLP